MTRCPGLVSVIMPAFNAATTIVASVESVLEQTYTKWELIVVDDGSGDATLAVLEPFRRDARIIVLQQANAGVAAARNHGISHCRGEFIAFLDADDLWLPTKIAAQVSAFSAADASLGLVHSRYVAFSSDTGTTLRKDDDGCFGYLPPNRRILVYDFIATSTVMLRASVFDENGLFDERLTRAEDWDLWIRIVQHYRQYKLDETLMKYRVNPAGLSMKAMEQLIEEKKVIEKQLLNRGDVTDKIVGKALFYYYLKTVVYCVSSGRYRKLVTDTCTALIRWPRMFLDLTNYLDAMKIMINRHLLKKW